MAGARAFSGSRPPVLVLLLMYLAIPTLNLFFSPLLRLHKGDMRRKQKSLVQ
jgi:hypothetical protein